MASKQIKPYHSARGRTYHIYGVCNVGKSIKKRLSGTNGKLCKICNQIRAGYRPR